MNNEELNKILNLTEKDFETMHVFDILTISSDIYSCLMNKEIDKEVKREMVKKLRLISANLKTLEEPDYILFYNRQRSAFLRDFMSRFSKEINERGFRF